MVRYIEYIIGEPWVKIVFEDGSYETLSERTYFPGMSYLEEIRYTDSGELRFHFLISLDENTITRVVLGVREIVKMVTENLENPNNCYDDYNKILSRQQFFGGF